ncbi:MAG: PLP-dependent aminotransferase family protein [Gammaproteobacteria bacterium]|nr:PLP-dependent aminotransferase family protein [Gammaproteobacteria bacterium]MDH5801702.1 PLP-dependent aminotransferase family protein [Gammaproteobacteria bacterium]
MREEFLYQRLADDLIKAIRRGVYAPKEKLPSIRSLCKQYKVSMATVLEALNRLEESGLAQAKPRSGYFVTAVATAEEPAVSRPAKKALPVSVGQLAMELVQEARSDRLIKLGAAVPGPDMLPGRLLARSSAAVIRQSPDSAIYYENARGNTALRRYIARLMGLAGCKTSPDDIIITNGCLEALNLALRAVAKRGDTIAIESPTYFGILQVIETLGMKALEIPTHPGTGIELAALQLALEKHKIAACVLMPTFSNPLGSCMPESHKQTLVRTLIQNNIPLIEDDIYGGLSFSSPRPKAAKAFDHEGQVIYCSSFSKTIAPGFRVGWMIPGQFMESVAYAKFLDNISTSTLPQLTLAEFLSKGRYSRYLQQSAATYQFRVQQLRHWISEYFPVHTRISNPQGGFVLWIELPQSVDCMELYRRAMNRKISISPGIIFSAQSRYRHHIRMSCGFVEGETARKAVKVLGQIAHELV